VRGRLCFNGSYAPPAGAQQRAAKKFYAACQFGATAYSVFAPPDIAFACVLAIEIASLLMTLVRKNKVRPPYLSSIRPWTSCCQTC